MPEEKETCEESTERRALRELVEAIRSNAKFRVLSDIHGTCGTDVVVMSHPPIASALREAEAVLGVKVWK